MPHKKLHVWVSVLLRTLDLCGVGLIDVCRRTLIQFYFPTDHFSYYAAFPSVQVCAGNMQPFPQFRCVQVTIICVTVDLASAGNKGPQIFLDNWHSSHTLRYCK